MDSSDFDYPQHSCSPCPFWPALARTARSFRRQRLRRADLRNRLAPVASTRDRLQRHVNRGPAGHVDGRHVHRQPAVAAADSRQRKIRSACTPCSNWLRASAAFWCSSACRFSRMFMWRESDSGLPNAALRAICCAICLLPPTILMGATLPLIARWVESTPSAAAWWGYFYGANIAGGVLGCFLAGFYLLRVYDMSVASYLAAAINLAIALASFGILQTQSDRGQLTPLRPVNHNIGRAPLGRLLFHWRLGPDRAGSGSCVDAIVVADARPHHLYVLHHSGRISRGAGYRQRSGFASRRQKGQSPCVAGKLPGAARAHHRLGWHPASRLAAILAG